MSHRSPRRPGWRGARPGCQHRSDHGARAEQLPRGQTCRTSGSVPELPHGAASAVLPQTARAPPVPRSCEPLPDTGPQAPSNGDTWPPDAGSPLRPRMLPDGAPPAARRRPLSILLLIPRPFHGTQLFILADKIGIFISFQCPGVLQPRHEESAARAPDSRVPAPGRGRASCLRSGSPFPLAPWPVALRSFPLLL